MFGGQTAVRTPKDTVGGPGQGPRWNYISYSIESLFYSNFGCFCSRYGSRHHTEVYAIICSKKCAGFTNTYSRFTKISLCDGINSCGRGCNGSAL